MSRRIVSTWAVVLLATVLLTGCRISRSTPTEENSVSTQVERTHRLDVDLSGAMPTREQFGFVPGRSQRTYTGDPSHPVDVAFRLAGGRDFTVPAGTVTVETTAQAVTTPRSPEAPDQLMVPNAVAATQYFTTRDEARQLLLDRVDLLGFDPEDIDIWYRSAPEAKGPNVLLNRFGFSGRQPIGYARVGVTIIMSDLAYIIWNVSWDPPIPGYASDSSGVPRPTSS